MSRNGCRNAILAMAFGALFYAAVGVALAFALGWRW